MSFNPFDTRVYDLGTDAYSLGLGKADVDISFSNPRTGSDTPCVYCGTHANYRLVAKVPALDSEQLRKQGFICENCIKQARVSPDSYGIREIK